MKSHADIWVIIFRAIQRPLAGTSQTTKQEASAAKEEWVQGCSENNVEERGLKDCRELCGL